MSQLGDLPVVLSVSHNIEVAHRLLNLPGKCQNIHGHSMFVTLEIWAQSTDENGYALGADGTLLEFGKIKKDFREYLDEMWDHHLHLNEKDPWARSLNSDATNLDRELLPGLLTWPADPSTENIARWICNACEAFVPDDQVAVSIRETRTNGVGVFSS